MPHCTHYTNSTYSPKSTWPKHSVNTKTTVSDKPFIKKKFLIISIYLLVVLNGEKVNHFIRVTRWAPSFSGVSLMAHDTSGGLNSNTWCLRCAPFSFYPSLMTFCSPVGVSPLDPNPPAASLCSLSQRWFSLVVYLKACPDCRFSYCVNTYVRQPRCCASVAFSIHILF